MHAIEHVLPGGGRVQATQRVHGGGLARATGAHDGDKITCLNFQVDTLERLQGGGTLAVGFGDAYEFNQGRSAHGLLAALARWSVMTAMPSVKSPPVISVMRPSLMPGVTFTATGCAVTQHPDLFGGAAGGAFPGAAARHARQHTGHDVAA